MGNVLLGPWRHFNCEHLETCSLEQNRKKKNSKTVFLPNPQILRDVVVECLTTTEQSSWNSITIPAIGTGNLGFPKPLVAKLMFDEAFKFSQKQNAKSLKEVHFVLHPSDTSSIKVLWVFSLPLF